MKHFISLTATIILSMSALFGLHEQPSQPVSQPAPFSAYPLKSSSVWVSEMLATMNVTVSDNVKFVFQNEDNCGAEISSIGMGGCTVTQKDGTFVVLISPELAYTYEGNHILFHEIAHTLGMGECDAEYYAHRFEETPIWSYPSCAPQA